MWEGWLWLFKAKSYKRLAIKISCAQGIMLSVIGYYEKMFLKYQGLLGVGYTFQWIDNSSKKASSSFF